MSRADTSSLETHAVHALSDRMAARLTTLSLAASLIAAVGGMPSIAYASLTEPPPWRWDKGLWRLSLQTSYFFTEANYETRGIVDRLPGDNSYRLAALGARARYHLLQKVSVYFGGGFAQALSQDPTLEREKTAFTDAVFGADWLLAREANGVADLVAELEGSFAIDQIDVDTTDALTNDGVNFLKALLFAHKSFPWFNIQGHVGGKFRAEGLASLLLWGVGAEKPLGKRYLLGAGVEGYETLGGDEVSEADRKTLTDRVNAGSFAFYSFDPALIEARAWAGWNPINAGQLRVGYGRTFNGVRSAAGQTVFLQLSYDFNPQPDRDSFDYYRSRRALRRKTNQEALKDFEPTDD